MQYLTKMKYILFISSSLYILSCENPPLEDPCKGVTCSDHECILPENMCNDIEDCSRELGNICFENQCRNICRENNVDCGIGGVCFATSDTEYQCGCISTYTLVDGKCVKEHDVCTYYDGMIRDCNPYYCRFNENQTDEEVEAEMNNISGESIPKLCIATESDVAEIYPINSSYG